MPSKHLQGVFWGKNLLKRDIGHIGSLQTQCLCLSFPCLTASLGQMENLPPLGATGPGDVPVPNMCPHLEGAKYEGSEAKMEERLKNEGKGPKN